MNRNIVACTADVPVPPKTKNKNIRAIFEKKYVWPQGSNGTISITFDTTGASSAMGTNSNNGDPSMKLGWIDPPLESFEMDGYTFAPDITNEKMSGCSITSCEPYSTTEDTTCVVSDDPDRICDNNYIPGGTVLHEFGHALGMRHEHQNYLGGNVIEYDIDGATLFMLKDGVQKKYYDQVCLDDFCTKLCLDESIRPDFCPDSCNKKLEPSTVCNTQWDDAKESAQGNILDKYECTEDNCPYEGSDFDPDSLMIYNVADYMIKPNTDGKRVNPAKKNYQYSEKDQEWLSRLYPVDSVNPPTINVVFNDGEDWRKYW